MDNTTSKRYRRHIKCPFRTAQVSILDHQEVVFLINQLVQEFEERACWEACNIMVITINLADKHASKPLRSEASCSIDTFTVIHVCCKDFFGIVCEVNYRPLIY